MKPTYLARRSFVCLALAVLFAGAGFLTGALAADDTAVVDAIPAPGVAQGTLGFSLKEFERQRVLKAANEYINDKPVTITSFPTTRSAGGLHDYYSQADYYWPNPDDPNGPYVNRDGQSNPDNFNDHRLALIHMSIKVAALTAAYEISGDNLYASHAVDHLRAWFVDPATMMNPNLLYSQAVTHLNTGRSIGIIDTLHLVEVARSVEILRRSGAIDKDDLDGVTKWFADYMKWMTTHPHGLQEGNARNNHATCYWLQVSAFAHMLGDEKELAECRRRFKEQLLPQIAENGSFPQELRRTKPYCYSMFNLDQMTALAWLLSTPTDNLFEYKTPDGRSLRNGPAYMYPYVKDKSAWPLKPDVQWWQYWPVRSCTWLFGGLAYNQPQYIDLWKTLEANPTNEEVLRNLPIRQPVLWVD